MSSYKKDLESSCQKRKKQPFYELQICDIFSMFKTFVSIPNLHKKHKNRHLKVIEFKQILPNQ